LLLRNENMEFVGEDDLTCEAAAAAISCHQCSAETID